MIHENGHKLGVNPYLPSWEYIPDAEPHVFGDRVYIYGSHDRFNGYMYCLNDYVCWSAPVDDLREWRYEGVILKTLEDPFNPDGDGALYAPDVCQGSDGRFYLYYVLSNKPFISVAVSDVPQGPYKYLGRVQDSQGGIVGLRPGDEPQFDPAVLNEGDKTYLYTGFCLPGDTSRSGPMAMTLGPDMMTLLEEPVFIMPSEPYSAGSGYEGHEFFEAPSIRKINDLYYFVYSSVKMYELCYAVSSDPRSGFVFGGTIISNNDMGIDSYKPFNKPMYYGGNNHGGMEIINGQAYIFYHRHTNGSNYSRQTCAEKIEIAEDGSIAQVNLTSCGLNPGPLPAEGQYPAYIACNLFGQKDNPYTGGMGENGLWLDSIYPKITQDGSDEDPKEAFILNMTKGSTAGFKSFSNLGMRKRPSGLRIWTRGYGSGVFEVRTKWDGKVLAEIPVGFSNVWKSYAADVKFTDDVFDLYLTFNGEGSLALLSFAFE